MGKIAEYDAGQLALQPSEIGIESTAAAARRIGPFYRQMGAELGSAIKETGEVAVKYAEHQEINRGAAGYATMFDNLTQQWNQAAKDADPNDPTVAAKFREGVLEPTLEKYRDSFFTEGGQRFAEGRIDHLRQTMFHQTASDMSTLAAQAVVQNVREGSNRLSNAAYTNPELVNEALSGAKELLRGITDSSPSLTADARGKLMTEHLEKMNEGIVKAAAIGAIRKASDPEAEAEKWATKYPQYITGPEAIQLGNEAKRVGREDRAWERWQRTQGKQDAQDRSDKASNDVIKNIYGLNPTITPREIS